MATGYIEWWEKGGEKREGQYSQESHSLKIALRNPAMTLVLSCFSIHSVYRKVYFYFILILFLL